MFVGGSFDFGERDHHFIQHACRELLAFVVIGITGLGRDREAWRHGQAGVGHFGQVRAFAAQQIFHRGVAFGFAIGEQINIFLRHYFQYLLKDIS